MKPWKIAIPLIVIVVALLLLRPLLISEPEPIEAGPTASDMARQAASTPRAPAIDSTPDAAVTLEDDALGNDEIAVAIRQFQQSEDFALQLEALLNLAEADTSDPRVRAFLTEGVAHPDPDLGFICIEIIRNSEDDRYLPGLRPMVAKAPNPEAREQIEDLILFLSSPTSYQSPLE
ncbi:MAG: hypothetical protein ACQKBV_01750 [Puniceicoccales bacterium]